MDNRGLQGVVFFLPTDKRALQAREKLDKYGVEYDSMIFFNPGYFLGFNMGGKKWGWSTGKFSEGREILDIKDIDRFLEYEEPAPVEEPEKKDILKAKQPDIPRSREYKPYKPGKPSPQTIMVYTEKGLCVCEITNPIVWESQVFGNGSVPKGLFTVDKAVYIESEKVENSRTIKGQFVKIASKQEKEILNPKKCN